MPGGSGADRDLVFVTPERERMRSTSETTPAERKKRSMMEKGETEDYAEQFEGILGDVMNARAELELLLAGSKKGLTVALSDTIRELFSRAEDGVHKVTVRAAVLEGRLAERERVEA